MGKDVSEKAMQHYKTGGLGRLEERRISKPNQTTNAQFANNTVMENMPPPRSHSQIETGKNVI